jgi:hypothetical protein
MKRMVEWKKIQEMAFEVVRTRQYLDRNTRFHHTLLSLTFSRNGDDPISVRPPRLLLLLRLPDLLGLETILVGSCEDVLRPIVSVVAV